MIDWMDGPDHYGTNAALLIEGPYAQANNVSLVANAGPGGKGTVFRMTIGGGGSLMRLVLSGNRSEVGIGQRVSFPNLPTVNRNAGIAQWRDATNTVLGTLYVNSTGALEYVTGGGISLLVTGPLIVSSSFQHVECRIAFSATEGSININVNSLPVTGGSIDNVNTGDAPCAQVALQSFTPYDMRDLYVWDTTGDLNNSGMQGDRECLLSLVDDDGPEQAWAYSAGASGWPLLSNVPPDDTQYVYSDVAGDKSDFGIEPVSTDITSISAIRIVARAWKSDAGLGTMSLNMRSGATVSESVEQGLSTEKIYYSQIIEKDPNTGNKFTPVGLNAALPEIERVQ